MQATAPIHNQSPPHGEEKTVFWKKISGGVSEISKKNHIHVVVEELYKEGKLLNKVQIFTNKVVALYNRQYSCGNIFKIKIHF